MCIRDSIDTIRSFEYEFSCLDAYQFDSPDSIKIFTTLGKSYLDVVRKLVDIVDTKAEPRGKRCDIVGVDKTTDIWKLPIFFKEIYEVDACWMLIRKSSFLKVFVVSFDRI